MGGGVGGRHTARIPPASPSIWEMLPPPPPRNGLLQLMCHLWVLLSHPKHSQRPLRELDFMPAFSSLAAQDSQLY